MILPQRAAFLSPQFITTALCATASLFSFLQQIMFFLKWEEQEENEGFQLNPRALSAKQMWLHTILIAGCNDSARKTDKTNSLHIHSCNRKHDPNGFFFPPPVPTGRHTRSAFFFINQCAHGCQQHSLCTRALKVKSYINTAGDMDVSVHTSTFCCNNRKCSGTRENQRLIRLLGTVRLNVRQWGEGIYAAVFRYPKWELVNNWLKGESSVAASGV